MSKSRTRKPLPLPDVPEERQAWRQNLAAVFEGLMTVTDQVEGEVLCRLEAVAEAFDQEPRDKAWLEELATSAADLAMCCEEEAAVEPSPAFKIAIAQCALLQRHCVERLKEIL